MRYADAVEQFPTLRQSRLATFDRCGLSARFEDLYRQGWSGHPQARGTIFHHFAAKALKAMYAMESRSLPQDVAVTILEEAIRQDDADQICPTCPEPIVERFEEAGFPRIRCAAGHEHSSSFVNIPMEQIKDLRWVAVKFATDNEFDIDNLVDVEQRLRGQVTYTDPDGERVTRELTGQLDALFVSDVDDHAIVLDWKDTWGLPGPTDVGFDGYFQQRFYAFLVFANYPHIKKVTLREFYVRYSEPREATVFRGDMEDVERELEALVLRYDRAFTEGVFPPAPGTHCSFCPRPQKCPIFTSVRGEGAIESEEMARTVAAHAVVAKSALKQRTEALKAWASVHGAVPISDHKGKRAWGHKPIKRTARPERKEMESALREARATGQPVNLDSLWREATTTRFEPHVPAPVDEVADDAKLMSALEQSIKQTKRND